jgi:hypothetical protein
MGGAMTPQVMKTEEAKASATDACIIINFADASRALYRRLALQRNLAKAKKRQRPNGDAA